MEVVFQCCSFQGLTFFLWVEKLAFGWYAYSALLTGWEGGAKKQAGNKCKCRGRVPASVFLLMLTEPWERSCEMKCVLYALSKLEPI